MIGGVRRVSACIAHAGMQDAGSDSEPGVRPPESAQGKACRLRRLARPGLRCRGCARGSGGPRCFRFPGRAKRGKGHWGRKAIAKQASRRARATRHAPLHVAASVRASAGNSSPHSQQVRACCLTAARFKASATACFARRPETPTRGAPLRNFSNAQRPVASSLSSHSVRSSAWPPRPAAS